MAKIKHITYFLYVVYCEIALQLHKLYYIYEDENFKFKLERSTKDQHTIKIAVEMAKRFTNIKKTVYLIKRTIIVSYG